MASAGDTRGNADIAALADIRNGVMHELVDASHVEAGCTTELCSRGRHGSSGSTALSGHACHGSIPLLTQIQ